MAYFHGEYLYNLYHFDFFRVIGCEICAHYSKDGKTHVQTFQYKSHEKANKELNKMAEILNSKSANKGLIESFVKELSLMPPHSEFFKTKKNFENNKYQYGDEYYILENLSKVSKDKNKIILKYQTGQCEIILFKDEEIAEIEFKNILKLI